MLKLKMMFCVMMLPLVVVGCTSKQSVSQCVKPPRPPAWIMQPPRLADTAEWDYFTLRERLITMQNNWKEPRSILMSSADRVARYRWATHAIIVSNTHALPAEYKCPVNKPSNPFTNVCWVSVLTTFSAPPQILAASVSFLLPNSRNEEMMGDGFPCATAAGLF